MKRRAIIFKNIRIQKMAEFLILLGLSIVFALVSAILWIEIIELSQKFLIILVQVR